jgi:diguanylate cyclase (GGDEF)-like protein
VDELRAVSAAMTDRLRESDAVRRLGRDEFAILLLDLDEAVALRLANDLLERVRAIHVDTPHGCGWTTASVGIAYISSFAELESDQLIERADRAMYLAKKCRGDRAEAGPSPALVG